MLRRGELLVCGAGAPGSARGWEPPQAGGGEGEGPEGAYPHPGRGHQLKERQLPPPKRVLCGGGGAGRPGWHPRRRGRHPSCFRAPGGRRHHHHHPPPPPPERGEGWPRCSRPARPRVLLSLRPVNLMGRRAPGMRAPRNTNQFLMQEKYQLMHLRSDSVGTESGGSDCEMDPLDMDSYLGVLENARGALMDCPAAGESPGTPTPTAGARPLPSPSPAVGAALPAQAPGLRPFFGGCSGGVLQEENSLQYFPSEDDVIESEIFMERDFHEFCSSISA